MGEQLEIFNNASNLTSANTISVSVYIDLSCDYNTLTFRIMNDYTCKSKHPRTQEDIDVAIVLHNKTLMYNPKMRRAGLAVIYDLTDISKVSDVIANINGLFQMLYIIGQVSTIRATMSGVSTLDHYKIASLILNYIKDTHI